MTIIKDWADNVLNLQNQFTPYHSTFPRSFTNWDSAEDYLCELLGVNTRHPDVSVYLFKWNIETMAKIFGYSEYLK